MHGPVVQRQRLLSYKQETMVQLHPGLVKLRIVDFGFRIECLQSAIRNRNSAITHVLVEQPGVLACLSRRRSRVQIPSRTPFDRCTRTRCITRQGMAPGGSARTNMKRRSTQTGKAAKLKPSRLSAGSTPACATYGLCSSWRPVKPSSQKKRGGRREVRFLHNPLWPVRLLVGQRPLKPPRRVRFPHGSLIHGQVA